MVILGNKIAAAESLLELEKSLDLEVKELKKLEGTEL